MPIYTVTSVEGCLDASKRAKIVSEITRTLGVSQNARSMRAKARRAASGSMQNRV